MAMPQAEGVVSGTPSPELLSRPGANGETEASLSQRRPRLLPALRCRERGWVSCLPAPGGRVTVGSRVDSDPTPLAGGASFPEGGGPGGPGGPGGCLVPRVGPEAAQTLLQGPEKVPPRAPGALRPLHWLWAWAWVGERWGHQRGCPPQTMALQSARPTLGLLGTPTHGLLLLLLSLSEYGGWWAAAKGWDGRALEGSQGSLEDRDLRKGSLCRWTAPPPPPLPWQVPPVPGRCLNLSECSEFRRCRVPGRLSAVSLPVVPLRVGG